MLKLQGAGRTSKAIGQDKDSAFFTVECQIQVTLGCCYCHEKTLLSQGPQPHLLN